jgi:hypothetical protein
MRAARSPARELSELMQPCPRALETYRPYIRYVLTDRGQWDKTELSSVRNLVAALFRLENSRTRTELNNVLGTLREWLSSPEQASLRRSFAVWLGRGILARKTGVENLQEMRSMLFDRICEWEQEAKREGEQEILLRVLLKRFGSLPDWAQARVKDAQMPQLEQWSERLLETDSLHAVFGEDEPQSLATRM